jgi:hypothetical protein
MRSLKVMNSMRDLWMCMKQLVMQEGEVELVQYLMDGCPQVPQRQDQKMLYHCYREQCVNMK